MAIEDRLKPEIILVSPSEDGEKEYVAKWIGDPVTKEKKLGLFDSPKVKGTKVQDLKVKGDRHQLTIFFDDPDHDETSAEFWESLNATGNWEITHPTIGLLNLSMIRATWENEPVRSVGYTTFNMNWVEGLPEGADLSPIELGANLNASIFDAIQSAIDQFISIITLETFEEFNSIVSAVNKAVSAIKKNLKKFENLQLINPRLEALFRGIASTISDFENFDSSALAAQFSGLYEAMGLAQNNSNGAIDNITSVVFEMDDIETDDSGTNGRNAAAVLELNMSLANTEVARAALLPGLVTRDQAVETATSINDYFDTMTNQLDEIQENFTDTPIENQYISQSLSYADQLDANKSAIKLLLNTALSLKVERRFTTKVPRHPMEIAWTELDGPGEYIEVDGIQIDQNYQDFCDWNDLHGNDLLWLPAETEVRIFV